MFKVLQDNIAARDIEERLGVSAKRLIMDGDGAVSGIWLDDGNGPKAFEAKQGVIPACGGLNTHPRCNGSTGRSILSSTAAFVGNTGDGIRMTTDLGADLWHMWHFHGTYGFRHPDLPFAIRTVERLPGWVPGVQEAEAPMSWTLVGKNGRRFMNEYDPYMQDTSHRGMDRVDPMQMGQPYVPCYMILDDQGRALYPLGQTMFNDSDYESYEWSRDNLREVQNGLIKKADSIEELADMIGCPAEELVATVESWNLSCDAGADDMGRPPKSMVPLRKPPYYLAEVWPIVSNTQGGPVHDEKRRSSTRMGSRYQGCIPRVNLAGIWGNLYLSGGNLTECFVSGRIAGRAAAGEAER